MGTNSILARENTSALFQLAKNYTDTKSTTDESVTDV